MTAKRYDVIYPRNYERKDGQKGVDWLRVGVAFETDRQFAVTLYAFPVGSTEVPGEVRLLLRESDGREQQRGGQRGPQVERRPQRQSPPDAQGWPEEDPDGIPF